MTNAPRTVRAGDKEYLVGALKLADLGRLQRWIGEHTKRPSEALRESIDLIPEAERSRAVAEARAADYDWPPAPGTVLGNTLLFRDPAGKLEFLRVMFGKFQAITEAELDTLAAGMSEVDFAVLSEVAFGDADLDPEQLCAAVRERLEATRALQMAAALMFARTLADGEKSSPTSGEADGEPSPTPSESSPCPNSTSSPTTGSYPEAEGPG